MPLEVISAYAVNQAANSQLTMFGDDSNVLRNFADGKKAYLLNIWGEDESADSFGYVRSPRMHDNVNGIQYVLEGPGNQFYHKQQELIAQDNLNLYTGTVKAADEYANHHFLIYYEALKASMGNYKTFEELRGKLGQVMTLKHTITPTSNTNYSGGEVCITDQDEFDALKDYAFMGFRNFFYDANGCVFLRGHDTGNLRIGHPFQTDVSATNEYFFFDLARKTGLPVIPIINAANKDNTFVDCCSCETQNEITFFSYWAELIS
jgi:hypothetical protein